MHSYYPCALNTQDSVCCLFLFSRRSGVGLSKKMPFVFVREGPHTPSEECDAISSGSLFHSSSDIYKFPGKTRIADFLSSYVPDQLESFPRIARLVQDRVAKAISRKKLSRTGVKTAITVALATFPLFTTMSRQDREDIVEEYNDSMSVFISFYLAPIPPPPSDNLASHVIDTGIFEME